MKGDSMTREKEGRGSKVRGRKEKVRKGEKLKKER